MIRERTSKTGKVSYRIYVRVKGRTRYAIAYDPFEAERIEDGFKAMRAVKAKVERPVDKSMEFLKAAWV